MRLSSKLREKIESIPVDLDYKISNSTIKEIDREMSTTCFKYRNKYYDFNGKELKLECVLSNQTVKTNKGFKHVNHYTNKRCTIYWGKVCSIHNVDNNLLLRRYQVYCYANVNSEWTYNAREIERILICKNKDTAYFSLARIMGTWRDCYNFNSNMRYRSSVKVDNEYICCDRTLSKPNWVCKHYDLKNIQGYIKNFINDLVNETPMFETVLKHSRWLTSVYTGLICYKGIVRNRAIKMIIRSKKPMCDFFDMSNYRHYIQLMIDLNKEFNPLNVWTNWKELNPKYEKEFNKIKEKTELKNNIAKYQIKYEEEHKNLLNYHKQVDNFKVDFLNSVKDFKEEADSMCHCVYRMGYYKKATSWVFSIKDINTGKRLETCEITSDKAIKINQCYGYGDKFTEQHDSILAVMNNLIKTELTQIIKGA